MFQWKHYSMKFRLCHKHSQRPSESFQPRFSSSGFLILQISTFWKFSNSSSTISRRNWDDPKVPRWPRRRAGALCQIWQESEISMKILKCCFFSKEFQQKLKQNPIFKNTELFWRKIPFYRKSHFTWRNLVRFGKPIIPFYRDPILSRMYCS